MGEIKSTFHGIMVKNQVGENITFPWHYSENIETEIISTFLSWHYGDKRR